MEQRYEQLETEKRNERTEHIDECTTLEILELINVEDGKVAKAVEKALPQIVDAVEDLQPLRKGRTSDLHRGGNLRTAGHFGCSRMYSDLWGFAGDRTGLYRRR